MGYEAVVVVVMGGEACETSLVMSNAVVKLVQRFCYYCNDYNYCYYYNTYPTASNSTSATRLKAITNVFGFPDDAAPSTQA